MTPVAFRNQCSTDTFTHTLPKDFQLPYLRRALSRDPHSVTEKLDGDICTAAVQLDSGPA